MKKQSCAGFSQYLYKAVLAWGISAQHFCVNLAQALFNLAQIDSYIFLT